MKSLDMTLHMAVKIYQHWFDVATAIQKLYFSFKKTIVALKNYFKDVSVLIKKKHCVIQILACRIWILL